MELGGCVRSTAGDNLGFSYWSRMLYADVETPSPDGIPQATFLVTGDYGEGNALCINGAEFRDRELVRRQGFKQEGFFRHFHLVQFIDQQHTWAFAFERAHKRSGSEEVAAL